MADTLTIGHIQDTNSRGGNTLNTGSMRRSYGSKKTKKGPKIRICNNRYIQGK